MVRIDHEQSGKFSLRSRVRLERDGRESSDLSERAFQLVEQLSIPVRLIERGEWMDLRETRPGNRHHLGGRVQLHRAGAERNHRVYQGEGARLKLVHVAEHFCLRMVPVDY